MKPSFYYENALRKKGFNCIAGVDEVGRGPLAGPLVAAAVIFPPQCKIKGINDSKKLSPAQREKLWPLIRRQALSIWIAIVGHREIDKLGIEKANRLAMKLAVDNLDLVPDFVLIDGQRCRVDLPLPQKSFDKGDSRSVSIAAASIIAKVTRDRLMKEIHEQFPTYRFDKHKGYGTREHLKLLSQHGPCAIHRRSFRPVGATL